MAEKSVRDMSDEEYEEHLAKFNAENEALGDDPVDYDVEPDPGFLSVGVRPREYPQPAEDDEGDERGQESSE